LKKVPLFRLPFLSQDASALDLVAGGGDLAIRFVVGGTTWELRFTSVRAFCKRAESHCTAWHFEQTLDTVCEVQESGWVRDLRADSSEQGRRWAMNHYVLTLDSWGCLEVVSESASEPRIA
jgi:hypothetical protein